MWGGSIVCMVLVPNSSLLMHIIFEEIYCTIIHFCMRKVQLSFKVCDIILVMWNYCLIIGNVSDYLYEEAMILCVCVSHEMIHAVTCEREIISNEFLVASR